MLRLHFEDIKLTMCGMSTMICAIILTRSGIVTGLKYFPAMQDGRPIAIKQSLPTYFTKDG